MFYECFMNFLWVQILCVCATFYDFYSVFMNFIYYSYFCILVIGLILFTNVVLKFRSGYPSGPCLDPKCISGPGMIFRSGFTNVEPGARR
jgi:hypothetical protein